MDTTQLQSQDLTLFLVVTILGFIRPFISPIVKHTVKLLHRPSSREKQLLLEVKSLTKDLNGVSMVDEFARHARIQRNITKIRGELETWNKDKRMSQIKTTYGFIFFLRSIHWILVFVVNFVFRWTPVMVIPKELFNPWFPFGFIMAFPTGVEGLYKRYNY